MKKLEEAANDISSDHIDKIRSVAEELKNDSKKLSELKKNPTGYLNKVLPKGWHAHYIEGGEMFPSEPHGASLGEQLRVTMPVNNEMYLSICIYCPGGCS